MQRLVCRMIDFVWILTNAYFAGLVDYIGMLVKLPRGTENVFLGSAFMTEGMLMLVHKKHHK